jgi:hypothetical protein
MTHCFAPFRALNVAAGLSGQVFKGIMKLGFKVPTPVQRKAIPALLSGVDVVAMARTGSGHIENTETSSTGKNRCSNVEKPNTFFCSSSDVLLSV